MREDAIDGQSVFVGTSLAIGTRLEGIHVDESRIGRKQEIRMRLDRFDVFRRAFLDVGLHVEIAPGNEQTRQLVEQLRSDDAAVLVPLFPPRIREMHEDPRDTSVRSEARKQRADVGREDPQLREP